MTNIEQVLRARKERLEKRYDTDPRSRTDFNLGIITGLSQAIALFENEREDEYDPNMED